MSAGCISRNSRRGLRSESGPWLGQDRLRFCPGWHEKAGKRIEVVAVPGRVCRLPCDLASWQGCVRVRSQDAAAGGTLGCRKGVSGE